MTRMPLMTGVERRGLTGLVDLLSDEVLRRGTGALDVAGQATIYVVFGHPLHAVIGDLTGLAAVDGIGSLLRENPGLEVAWIPGRTAGKAHSISPSDGVMDRLRGGQPDHFGPDDQDADGGGDVVGELNLRSRIAAEQSPPEASQFDPQASELVGRVCAAIEGRLHMHARGLTEVIRNAPAEPAALLLAIERARSLPVRAVSRQVIATVLNDAEALVRETNRPT